MLSLVVREPVGGEVAVIYSVGGQIILRVELVGASARRRVIIHLVESLALGRQGSRKTHPQAAPRLHLDSLASLRRASL